MATEVSKALEKNVAFIERSLEAGQVRLMMRVFRQNTEIRKNVSASMLSAFVKKKLPSTPLRDLAIEELDKAPKSMEEEKTVEEDATTSLPEVAAYLLCLSASLLCRERLWEGAATLTKATAEWTRSLQSGATNPRSALEPLAAKIYFYLALSHEKLGRFEDVRGALLAAHRTACLQHNEMTQAVALNALVRGLLEANLVESASKLVSNSKFPETASNNQFCRYLYYTGRIQAMQLNYTDAFTKLTQSMRKAPANTALGFRRAVRKLAVLVQLLMGELPDRTKFQGAGIRKAMEPYLRLTQAVRRGSLLEFNQVVQANADVFKADKTYTLAIRLSQNVVKTGLRRLNISYSRISLEDVRVKLQLETSKSAEFVCAKAIKDGVIDAVIDHDQGFMRSKELTEIYATNGPQVAFHDRVDFCLEVHNEALKAMMYPADSYNTKNQPETKPEEKTDEELVKEIEDELGDDPL